MLEKLGNYLQGKKTWIVAALVGIGATLEYLGMAIPEWIYPILGALGLGAVRSALMKLEKK